MTDKTHTPSFTAIFANTITLVFVVLRLCGVIDWSWWLILSPTIVYEAIDIILLIIMVLIIGKRMSNDDERD